MWQDYAMMVAGFVFFIPLLITLSSKHKQPRKANFITFSVLVLLILVPQATLGLWRSAISTGFTATGHMILTIQRRHRFEGE